jgi:hypothetical protein
MIWNSLSHYLNNQTQTDIGPRETSTLYFPNKQMVDLSGPACRSGKNQINLPRVQQN